MRYGESKRVRWLSCMRRLAAALFLVFAVGASSATVTVSVGQLKQFLNSSEAAKLSDAEKAERLASVMLSERLTDSDLRELMLHANLGPRCSEQLQLLGAASSLLNTPPQDGPADPPPNTAMQRQMIENALRETSVSLRQLPDFIAMRAVQTYDNLPQSSKDRHTKPAIHMHWTGSSRREITYRIGHEELRAPETILPNQEPFSSWGEFGSILNIVLTDSFAGSVAWDRWEHESDGQRIAVFRYTIPRTFSHYSVDYCCYQQSLDGEWKTFRDKPGYHGEFSVNPANGQIIRISVVGDMGQESPVRSSGVVVDYGPISFGAETYLCPIHSIALSVIYSPWIDKIDGTGLERHINKVDFLEYHKFGSTARILPAD